MSGGVVQNITERLLRLLMPAVCFLIELLGGLPWLCSEKSLIQQPIHFGYAQRNSSATLTVNKKEEYFKNRDKRQFILPFW